MKIAVGADHRGYHLKAKVAEVLSKAGLEVEDFGAHSKDSSDYPDFAFPVATAVNSGECDRGVLICGTGIGMSITANKVKGIRAAVCHDETMAEISRRHNDSNILCLGADFLGNRAIDRIINTWLQTPFDGGRHERRVYKIDQGNGEE